jgi:hypothetical protein
MELPPIHVDHVAQAVCLAIENEEVAGPVGVRQMRELIGWRFGDETDNVGTYMNADSNNTQSPAGGH